MNETEKSQQKKKEIIIANIQTRMHAIWLRLVVI